MLFMRMSLTPPSSKDPKGRLTLSIIYLPVDGIKLGKVGEWQGRGFKGGPIPKCQRF